MDFPFWLLYPINTGLVIGIISVIHVFVAQLAVGGGFLLVYTQYKATRDGFGGDSLLVLKWVHKHTRFFLLLSMVFGGLSGVAIWFSIATVNPAGTRTLIDTFVFAWATEWVWFLAEIVALLVYFYTFPRMLDGHFPAKKHMRIGLLYALFAFLSLFVINGIISFMLTPGEWVKTGNFWHGFFNPTFWPSLIFRTGISLLLAGVFAFVTARSISLERVRVRMFSFAAAWCVVSFLIAVAGAVYYFFSVSEAQRAVMLHKTTDVALFGKIFLIGAPVLFVSLLLFFWKKSDLVRTPIVVLVFILAFITTGAFEWVRETARRPWVVYGVVYSNGLTPASGERIDKEGFLPLTPWIGITEITQENTVQVGRSIFVYQCATCHGVGAPRLDMVKLAGRFTLEGLETQLRVQGRDSSAGAPKMPPFFGTSQERRAVAVYLASLNDLTIQNK